MVHWLYLGTVELIRRSVDLILIIVKVKQMSGGNGLIFLFAPTNLAVFAPPIWELHVLNYHLS